MNLELRIERLVLEGLSIGLPEKALLLAAFEKELTRLLDEGELNSTLARGGAVPSLHGAPMQVNAGASPAHLGAEIARAVYGGLGPPVELAGKARGSRE